MIDHWIQEHGARLDLILTLAVGTALIVGSAALIVRLVRSAVWQRTIWQAAILALVGLLAVELTGTGAALVCLVRGPIDASPATEPDRGTTTRIAETTPRPMPADTKSVAPDGHLNAPNLSAFDIEIAEPVDLPASTSSDWNVGPERFAAAGSDFDNAESLDLPRFETFSNEDSAVEVPGSLAPASTVAGNTAIRPSSPTASNAQPVAATDLELESKPATPSGIYWWLGMTWLVGSLALVVRLVWSHAMLLWFRRSRTTACDAELAGEVKALADRLGIRRCVRVVEADGLSAPVTFGVLRPTVVLPTSFAAEFAGRQRKAILAHELAHLAAGDPTWQLIAGGVCGVLWWHPLAWWSRRRLASAAETAADEASLLVPDGPSELAGCLVALGRRLSSSRQLGWLSVEGPGFRSGLGRRVERLLNLRKRPGRTPRRGRMAAVKTAVPAVLVIVVLLFTAWARPRATYAEGGTTMSVLENSWRRSLAGVTLIALLSPISGDAADPLPADEPAAASADGELLLAFQDREGEREEGVRRDGDRPREGDRPRDGDRERDVDREREGDRPRDGEREEGIRRDGDRPREGDREREGDRPRDGDREEGVRRDGDRPREGDREREGDRPREGDRERESDREREREREGDQEREANRERESERERRPDPELRDRPAIGEDERHELMQHRNELIERARHIQREMAELPDEADEVAERLEVEMREIRERVGDIERRLRGVDRPDMPPQMRRIEELKRRIAELSEEGRYEEAEVLKREGREIMQMLERRRQAERPRPDVPEDLQRRLHHVRVAAENLRAAGFHEQAENLMRHAEEAIRGVREREEARRPEPAHGEGLERAVREMHEQMMQMRREMEEMRVHMRELMERVEHQEHEHHE